MTDYVSNDAWLHPAVRADAIDDVADHFERPVDAGAEQFWGRDAATGWPSRPRPWHGDARRLGIAS